MNKTILVTGASGILADAWMRQAAMDPDITLLALTNHAADLCRRFDSLPADSIFSWDALEAIPFAQVDVVLHCAFARTEAGADLALALERTSQLLRYIGRSPGKSACVSISSRSVYGQNPNLPWREDSALAPNSLYALAKVSQELLVEQAGEFYGFPCTNLRLAGLMGPKMDARILSKLIWNTLQGEDLNIIGGKQQFSLLDIRDAVAGISALLMVPPERWRKVYNLGSPNRYTLMELAERICSYTKEKYGIAPKISVEERDVRLLDAMDSSAFYADTGWKPGVELQDTIGSIAQYFIKKR